MSKYIVPLRDGSLAVHVSMEARKAVAQGYARMQRALRVVEACTPDSEGGVTLGSYELSLVRHALKGCSA